MNKQRLKELLPLMQAWVNDKDVEYWSERAEQWKSVGEDPGWYDGNRYRIKPEPLTLYILMDESNNVVAVCDNLEDAGDQAILSDTRFAKKLNVVTFVEQVED